MILNSKTHRQHRAPGSSMADSHRKRRRSSSREKLLANEAVEVRSFDEGLLGSWHPGIITERERNRCLVRYDHLAMDDLEESLSEYVDVSSSINVTSRGLESPRNYLGKIRPKPPELDINMSLQYGICVDAYYQDAWWEGVVFEHQVDCGEWRVFFPDEGDVERISIDKLRLTQDWDEATGEWSLRGKWLFLDIIDEVKSDYIFPVSIKQIWYDLRENQNFVRVIQHWTFPGKDVWKDLILEVLNKYLKMVADEFVSSHLQDLGVYDKSVLPLDCNNNSEYDLPHIGKECPGSVAEYLKTRKRDDALTMKLKQHLLFLGWNIIPFVSGGTRRIRYRQPDGKSYYSLVKVCEAMLKVVPVRSEKNASLSSAMEIELAKSSHDVEESEDIPLSSLSSEADEYVQSKYCPEAIIKYLQAWDPCHAEKKRLSILSDNAKMHLRATGWKFWSKMKRGRPEARFTSPEKKTYYSLRQACKAVRDALPQESSKENQSGDLPLSADSELERSIVPFMQQSEEESLKCFNLVNFKSVRRKRSLVVHLRRPTSLSQEPNPMTESSPHSMPKKRKVRNSSSKAKDGSDVNQTNIVLRSGKRVRQMKTPSTLPYNPRTVLSLLIDNNILLPRAKVYYRGKDRSMIMAEGRVTRDGIKCGCCQNVFTLVDFESHARSPYNQPAAYIFLEDGRSLIDCQMEVLRNGMKKLLRGDSTNVNVSRKRKNMSEITNDYLCSVCHFGGDLILCDGCPSSYHANCLNMQGVPDGDWFCPSCCCAICDKSEPADNTLCCDQCERIFHASCLRGRGGVNLAGRLEAKWFCCRSCAQIFRGLQKFRTKTIPFGDDNLTWTLIKPMKYGSGDGLTKDHINMMAENYSKLSLALEVLHECFEPFKEPRTKRDLVEDVIFGRGSDLQRLNFTGFYTVLLEKNDELVSVATLRIYGDKVAEVPLVGTRFHFRRNGMCRILMDELEKMVQELGVERLLLPAVPSALNTWTGSFGFTKMTQSERSEFLSYIFLDFQGTLMCHKLLKEPAIPPSSTPKVCHQEVAELVEEVQGNGSLDDNPEDNETGESKDCSSEEMAKPENNPVNHKDDPISDSSACKFKGELKQYSRKKLRSSIRRVSGTNYPNVEVSCR